MLKRSLKIFGWIAGVLAGLILLAVIGLWLFFPMEKVKELAVDHGSAALGREIAIEDLSLSVWGGLGVKLQGVTIGNPDGFAGPPMLTAANIDLKMGLLPMIRGDYEVDRLIINEPTLVLHRLADGGSNFDFAPADSTGDGDDPAQPASPTAGPGAADTDISFDTLEIRRGALTYRDDAAETGVTATGLDVVLTMVPVRAGVYTSTVSMKLDEAALAGTEPLQLGAFELGCDLIYDRNETAAEISSLTLNHGGIEVHGTGNVQHDEAGLVADGELRADEIDIRKLLALAPAEKLEAMGDAVVTGHLDLEAEVAYAGGPEGGALTYAGAATISGLKVTRSDLPGDLLVEAGRIDLEPDVLRLHVEQGSFAGQPLTAQVTVVDFVAPQIAGELTATIDVAQVVPLVQPDMDYQLGGTVRAEVGFSGSADAPDDMTYSGHLLLSGGSVRSPSLPEAIDAITLDAQFDNEQIEVSELTATFPSGRARLGGRFTGVADFARADEAGRKLLKPRFDVDLHLATDLAVAGGFLPSEGSPQLGGALELDLNLAGIMSDPASLRPRGRVRVTDARYSDTRLPEPIEALSADLAVMPDSVMINALTVRFPSSDLALTGRLIDPLPAMLPDEFVDRSRAVKPRLLFELTSRRFDVDRLLPRAVPGGETEGAGPAGSPAGDPASGAEVMTTLPDQLDIDGRGRLRAETVVYSRVEFTDVTADVRLHDDKIICSNARAAVYSGHVTGETTVDLADLTDPGYTGAFDARQIEIDDFLARFTRFGGHIFGKTDVSGAFTAHGREGEIVRNSLTLDGRALLHDGRLITSGALYETLSEMASRLGSSLQPEQRLREFTSTVSVADGRVRTDQLTTKLGDLGDARLEGYYAFDGKLDYTGSILLTEQMTRKLGDLGSLLGRSGSQPRVQIPITMSGTIDKPQVAPDYSALGAQLGDQLTDELKDEAQNLIKGLFKKK